MTGIYGNRSIIPNNYYFTFDKIYKSESSINNSDDVLIGRTVLAKQESSVWLKTVGGYIKVAILDQTGRFLLSEGYNLDEYDDIDCLSGNGNTYNGDGLYVVDFNIVSTSNAEDGEKLLSSSTTAADGSTYYYQNWQRVGHGHWPDIRGVEPSNYLTGRVFLLRQTSKLTPIIDDGGNLQEGIANCLEQITSPNNLSEGAIYYEKQNDGTYEIKTVTKSDIASASSNITSWNYFIVTKQPVHLYQTLIDITDINKIPDIDENRKNLDHRHKTFYREMSTYFVKATSDNLALYTDNGAITQRKNSKNKGVTYFTVEDNYSGYKADMNNTTTNVYYLDDIYSFVNCSPTEADLATIKYNAGWSKWYDITETYTGYIGDLNPATVGNGLTTKTGVKDTNYNQYSVYYNGKNINDRNKKTEGNSFDNFLQSPGAFYVIENSKRNNLKTSNTLVEAINKLDEIIGSNSRFSSSGTVNSITSGSLSKSLLSDARTYKLPEDNIMDALVHHDADIGQLEDEINVDNFYNITFDIADNKETNLNGAETAQASIRSLTTAIKKMDNAIGSQNRLKRKNSDTVGKALTTIGKTKYISNDSNDNRYYYIPETNTVDTLVRLSADIGTLNKTTLNNDNLIFDYTINKSKDMTTSNKASVVSLTDAIQHMNKNIIGNVVGGFTEQNNVNNNSTIVTNINKLNEKIGKIDSILEDTNDILGEEDLLGETIDTTLTSKLQYLITTLMGYRSQYTNTGYNDLDSSTSIIENINQLNASIGNRLGNVSTENDLNSADTSIIDLINYLNKNVIGEIDSILEDTGDILGIEDSSGKTTDTTLTSKLHYLIKTLMGYRSQYENSTYNGLSNKKSIIENINQLNTSIGNRTSGVSSKNGLQSAKSNVINLINYLNDNIIGDRSELKEPLSKTSSLVTNLNTLNTKLGGSSTFTTTDEVNNYTVIIDAINYIVNNLIGELRVANDEGRLTTSYRATLQDQILDNDVKINTLAQNLNMTDLELDLVKAAKSNVMTWQTL